MPCYFSNNPLKGNFLDIYVTTFFGVRKFKNTSAMRVIFSLKMLKIESQFRKSKNNIENVFRFWDKCILKASNKWPLLRREYMSSAVNGWTNSPKTLHITQRDFFKLNYLQKDQKIWLRHCRSALNSVSARLPCYLSKHHLKGDFLDIYLTTFFGVRKFKNTSAMRVIFLLKMFKIESKFRKWKKKK